MILPYNQIFYGRKIQKISRNQRKNELFKVRKYYLSTLLIICFPLPEHVLGKDY